MDARKPLIVRLEKDGPLLCWPDGTPLRQTEIAFTRYVRGFSTITVTMPVDGKQLILEDPTSAEEADMIRRANEGLA